jgi:hypothetical protein
VDLEREQRHRRQRIRDPLRVLHHETDRIQGRQDIVTNAAQSQTEAVAQCPSGKVPLGGGEKASNTVQQAQNSSQPFGSGWRVFENNRDTSGHSLVAFAVCAKKPTGYAMVTSSLIASPGGSQAPGAVFCPAGTVPLSGGPFSNSSDLYADAAESWGYTSPTPTWLVAMDNVSSTATTFTVSAVCA